MKQVKKHEARPPCPLAEFAELLEDGEAGV